MSAQHRIDEALTDTAGFFFDCGTLLEAGDTPFQSYEVWDSPLLGTLFRLDGFFMTSERDEFFYHENLIHVPAISHPAPRCALIIGGGDGGSAEELLKHPTMTRVVLVELDGKVIDISRRYLASIHRGAFDDPRLALHVCDGLDYVRNTARAADEHFDLIVLDLTDPVGPAAELYSQAFFADCKMLLAHGGALSLHVGSPFYQPQRVRRQFLDLCQVFTHVSPYFVHIPLYGTLWGMACASDRVEPARLDPVEVDRRISARGLEHLQYYNGATHQAVQALPNYVRDLLAR
ncbi:MAG: polyamine aminopropyltransferase [Zoogloeaceae bacterium]|nr:polyamine aminopropyltransferase [Rhodocyclaceae bacterium]MCP5237101.1 polyamine aminopropyltransferase [Zoogloeaceae bacterium]